MTLIVSYISYSCLKNSNVPPIYSEIPDANFRAYLKTIVPLAFTPDDKFISNHPSVVSYNGTMYASIKKISSLAGIEYFSSLTGLDCTGNQITTLDVSRNLALTRLSCGDNKLSTLDLTKNTNLTILECYDNQLTNLDLSKNTNLEELNCYRNQLTALNLGNNENLRKVLCANNQLIVLDVSRNTGLIELNCLDNLRTTVVIINPNTLSRLYIDPWIKCSHPSIKAFSDRGGNLFGSYFQAIPPFTCS